MSRRIHTLKRGPGEALRYSAVGAGGHASACRPGGFTLIEMILALTLSALVVLLSHRVFTGVVDGAARLGDARLALDREANARRFLQEAFGSLDVGSDGAEGFAGRAERVEFSTWQRAAQGWLARRRLMLEAEGGSLVARGAADDALVLGDSVARVEFDYLLDSGANAAWVREWISPVSAPVAVRIRITGNGKRDTGNVDTLLVLIGPRG